MVIRLGLVRLLRFAYVPIVSKVSFIVGIRLCFLSVMIPKVTLMINFTFPQQMCYLKFRSKELRQYPGEVALMDSRTRSGMPFQK